MPERRFLVFAPEYLGPLSSKTANGLIRFRKEEVVAVYDPSKSGRVVQDILGYGGDIPIVASFEEGLAFKPDTVVVGIAPSGGRLREAWFPFLKSALEQGLEVWSGLHDFLTNYPDLKPYAERIWDLRKPPADAVVAKGHWKSRQSKVLLSVGADCNIGKMTASLTLQNQLKQLGVESVFVGTGQTGMAICGRGVAVDAVVADFIAGSIETEIMKVDGQAPLIIVEGQGTMTHQGFSGVTAGLLHGTMPDFMLMVHQPSRITDDFGVTIPEMDYLVGLHEQLLKPFSQGTVEAISIYSKDMTKAESSAACSDLSAQTGLVVEDMVRLPDESIARHIKSLLETGP